MRFFRACIEPILLYDSETWTFTVYLTKRLDGCYTRLLRKAKGWTFRDRKTNVELYGDLPNISDVVRRRKIAFAGHCVRCTDAPQPVQHIVFWEAPAKFIRGTRATMTYHRMMKIASRSVLTRYETLSTARDTGPMSRHSHNKTLLLPRCFITDQ